ncbi:MAG TPA: hypothetical protein VGI43_10750 [Mucilaginibacter sp.]|jgi:hypothetical protein
MDDKNEFLDKRLNKLGLGNEFNHRCAMMNYKTLRDIVSTPPQEILSREGFTYNWFGELIGYLVENQQLHLLQPTPGKTIEEK